MSKSEARSAYSGGAYKKCVQAMKEKLNSKFLRKFSSKFCPGRPQTLVEMKVNLLHCFICIYLHLSGSMQL